MKALICQSDRSPLMLPILGRTLLEHSVDFLISEGIGKIFLSGEKELLTALNENQREKVALLPRKSLRRLCGISDSDILIVPDNRIFTESIKDMCKLHEKEKSDLTLSDQGIFIVSKSAFSLLPDSEEPPDRAAIAEIFRQSDRRLSFFRLRGAYTIDSRESYLDCVKALLSVGYYPEPVSINGNIILSGSRFGGVKLGSPVYIGRNVRIAPGAEIGAFSAVGDNAVVCRGGRVLSSVVMSGAFIGENSCCTSSVIHENAHIPDGSRISEEEIYPEEIPPHMDYDRTFGISSPLTPETAARIGTALGRLGNIAAAFEKSPDAAAIAHALSAGACSAGSDCLIMEDALPAAAEFAAECSGAKFTCLCRDGKIAVRGGSSADIRRINRLLAMQGSYSVSGENYGKCEPLNPMPLYLCSLKGILKGELHGIFAEISCPHKGTAELLRDILRDKNDPEGERIIFTLSSDGDRISAFSEDGTFSHEKLLLLCCRYFLERDGSVTLPDFFPRAAEELAKQYDGYITRVSDGGEAFTRDCLRAVLLILEILRGSGERLSAAVKKLPDFAVSRRYFPTDNLPEEVIARVREKFALTEYGSALRTRTSRITVRPLRRGISLIAEAEMAETAAELCGFFEKEIRSADSADLR